MQMHSTYEEFIHVNQKALDQYMGVMEQHDQLQQVCAELDPRDNVRIKDRVLSLFLHVCLGIVK
jgi:hypothetical protein